MAKDWLTTAFEGWLQPLKYSKNGQNVYFPMSGICSVEISISGRLLLAVTQVYTLPNTHS